MDAELVRELRTLPDSPAHPFRPIEDDAGPTSGALNWYLLIRALEEFRRVTGQPLPEAWEHVRRAEYHEACAVFDTAVQRWRRAQAPRRR